MFGLAAIAAVAAMAFVGATSASAEDTALCNVHQEPCAEENQTETLHGKAIGDAFLLNNVIDVLCLNVLGTFSVGDLDNPQLLTANKEDLVINGCGTDASHNNCTVTINQVPTFLLLKTALNLGEVEGHGGSINVKCTVFFIVKLDCTYAAELGVLVPAEGALHTEGAGHGRINLEEVPAKLTIGGTLCPTVSSLDALLEPSSHVWITS